MASLFYVRNFTTKSRKKRFVRKYAGTNSVDAIDMY
jgi:hypothetical protein